MFSEQTIAARWVRLLCLPIAFVPLVILFAPLTSRFPVFIGCLMYLWPVVLVTGFEITRAFVIVALAYCTLTGLFVSAVLARLNELPKQVPLPRARRVLLGTWSPILLLLGVTTLDYKGVTSSGGRCPGPIQILYGHCANITHLRTKDLGGFIDTTYAARFDIRPEVLVEIVRARKLVKLNAERLPKKIWSQPPWWWDIQQNDDVLVYTTADFPFSGRGGDGDHYVMIRNVASNRVYVYLKADF